MRSKSSASETNSWNDSLKHLEAEYLQSFLLELFQNGCVTTSPQKYLLTETDSKKHHKCRLNQPVPSDDDHPLTKSECIHFAENFYKTRGVNENKKISTLCRKLCDETGEIFEPTRIRELSIVIARIGLFSHSFGVHFQLLQEIESYARAIAEDLNFQVNSSIIDSDEASKIAERILHEMISDKPSISSVFDSVLRA